MKEQLSLLETPLPEGAAPAWDGLDAGQRARVVWMLARLIAKVALPGSEPAEAADEEETHE